LEFLEEAVDYVEKGIPVAFLYSDFQKPKVDKVLHKILYVLYFLYINISIQFSLKICSADDTKLVDRVDSSQAVNTRVCSF